jgi:hypothetical protein
MPKYRVHIPEQTILVDADLLEGDHLEYWKENHRSLVLWDIPHGAFSQLIYELHLVGD